MKSLSFKVILLLTLIFISSRVGAVEFKVNSKVEQLSGVFKKFDIVKKGSSIEGTINVKSMNLSKKDKKEDLLEYFDSKNHPTTSFKAKVNGNKVSGTYTLKGKQKVLNGSVVDGKVKLRIPLTDLVTGFKAMFLGDKDHVELTVK